MNAYSVCRVIASARAGLLLVVGLALAGCTTIPQSEFAAYRDAFDAARTQSELVLADYGVGLQERANQAQEAVQVTSGTLSAHLGLATFHPQGERTGRSAIDARLAAWEILSQYNEALLAIAAGESDLNLADDVDGLLGSLQEFPVADVADAAADAVPYARVVSELLTIVQQEVQARRFREAILAAESLMRKFLGLLVQDASIFREHRFALLNEKYLLTKNELNGAVDRFRLLTAHSWGRPKPVSQLIEGVNEKQHLVENVKLFEPVEPVPEAALVNADKALETAQLAELQELASAISRQAGDARGTATQMQAYSALMDQYAALIGELSAKVDALAAAAAESADHLPGVDRLERILASTRVAHEIYTQSR